MQILKKWWFWIIIVFTVVIIGVFINQYIENKKLEETFKTMGESTSDYYKGTKQAEGYLDKFTYNYSTGTVDYSK